MDYGTIRAMRTSKLYATRDRLYREMQEHAARFTGLMKARDYDGASDAVDRENAARLAISGIRNELAFRSDPEASCEHGLDYVSHRMDNGNESRPCPTCS